MKPVATNRTFVELSGYKANIERGEALFCSCFSPFFRPFAKIYPIREGRTVVEDVFHHLIDNNTGFMCPFRVFS